MLDEMINDFKREELVRLIRRIAREVAWEVVDEHLDDYEHREKPAEDFRSVKDRWSDGEADSEQRERSR